MNGIAIPADWRTLPLPGAPCPCSSKLQKSTFVDPCSIFKKRLAETLKGLDGSALRADPSPAGGYLAPAPANIKNQHSLILVRYSKKDWLKHLKVWTGVPSGRTLPLPGATLQYR